MATTSIANRHSALTGVNCLKGESSILCYFGNRAPLGFQAGDDNLYRYVRNSPTNRTDPTGLYPEPEPISVPVAQAAADLGVNLEQVRIENGVARLVVGRANTITVADVRTISSHLRSLGANSVVIETYLENPRLSELMTNPRAVQLLLGNDTARLSVQGQITIGNATERLVQITAELRPAGAQPAIAAPIASGRGGPILNGLGRLVGGTLRIGGTILTFALPFTAAGYDPNAIRPRNVVPYNDLLIRLGNLADAIERDPADPSHRAAIAQLRAAVDRLFPDNWALALDRATDPHSYSHAELERRNELLAAITALEHHLTSPILKPTPPAPQPRDQGAYPRQMPYDSDYMRQHRDRNP
jgi:hypothetical protein